jgi:Uma2 family endonuclease
MRAGDNSTVRLDLDNEPQPDLLALIDPARGGQARVDDDDYVAGAPEFVAEIASSSVSYDLHVKLQVYRRSGVREYLVWRVLDRALDWFVLRNTQFERLAPDAAGVYRSEVLLGLWLDATALTGGDFPRVQLTLNQGLATPEHAAFVERLRPPSAPTA